MKVVVVGAGVFGSWTAWKLCCRGADVTLIDAWGPGNSRASSGGESRVIRSIYGTDGLYSEMVKQAFGDWRELAGSSDLYRQTGVIWMLHAGDDAYVRDALPVLDDLGFSYQQLTTAQAGVRWPQIDFTGVDEVVFEEQAGVLAARRCCRALADRLIQAGGQVVRGRLEPLAPGHGALRLQDGTALDADAVVLACGAWLGQLVPELAETITPTRQEVFFFGPPAGDPRFQPDHLPVWLELDGGGYYGLPDTEDRGFKLADDTRGPVIDPSTMDRTVDSGHLEAVRAYLARRFPVLADAPLLESRVCQYGNSPDGHLILDRHPTMDWVWLAGGGSGHGFKLGPVIGQRLADAVLEGDELPPDFALARSSNPKDQRWSR